MIHQAEIQSSPRRDAGSAHGAIEAFHSNKRSRSPRIVPISLWTRPKLSPHSPDLDGTIADRRVLGYITRSARGLHIEFVAIDRARGADGALEKVAFANVVVHADGKAGLALRLKQGADDGRTHYALAGESMPIERLVDFGLNLDKLRSKQRAIHRTEGVAHGLQ